MKFRLTTGENGTAFGKQKVIHEAEANNAIEFVKSYLAHKDPSWISYIINNGWVDAGSDTIPIAIMSLFAV